MNPQPAADQEGVFEEYETMRLQFVNNKANELFQLGFVGADTCNYDRSLVNLQLNVP